MSSHVIFVAKRWADEDAEVQNYLVSLIESTGMKESKRVYGETVETVDHKETVSIVEADAMCVILTPHKDETITHSIRNEISIAKTWDVPAFVFVEKQALSVHTLEGEIHNITHGLHVLPQWKAFNRDKLLSGSMDDEIKSFLLKIRRWLDDVAPGNRDRRLFGQAALSALRQSVVPFHVGLAMIADAYDKSPEVLWDRAAEAARLMTGARFAFLGTLERVDGFERIVLRGFAGINESDRGRLAKLRLGFDGAGNTEGITGCVAYSQMPILETDLARDREKLAKERGIRFQDPLDSKSPGDQGGEQVGIRSELCVPITLKGKVVGVIDVEDTDPDRFEPIHMTVLQWLARAVAISYSGEQLERFIEDLGRVASTKTDLARVVLDSLARWSLADYGFVALPDPDSGRCKVTAIYREGLLPDVRERADRLYVEPGVGLTGKTLEDGLPRYVTDVASDPAYLRYWPKTKAEAVLPIKGPDNGVVGIINLEYEAVQAFASVDHRLFEALARLVAIQVPVKGH